jgi:hypothetical protein
MITEELQSKTDEITKKRELGKTLDNDDLLILLLETLLREDGYGKSNE